MNEPTVALALKHDLLTVSLWCHRKGAGYYVINGDWFLHDKDVLLQEFKVVWDGVCPYSNYNDAICWINEQLSDNPLAAAMARKKAKGGSAICGDISTTLVDAEEQIKPELTDTGVDLKGIPLSEAFAWMQEKFGPIKEEGDMTQFNEKVRQAIAGFQPNIDGKHDNAGDNLSIILCTYFDTHPDKPALESEDYLTDAGWHPWVEEQVDLTIRLLRDTVGFVIKESFVEEFGEEIIVS